MLAPTTVIQTKGNKVGKPDCEALGFVFFPTYSVQCLGIAKSDAEDIFLCGLHESVLYQRPVPLIGLLVNKVSHLQGHVSTRFKEWWAGQPLVITDVDALPITNLPP